MRGDVRSKLRNRREDLILNFILSDRDYPYDPTFAACFLDLPEIVEHNLRSVLSSSAKKVGVSAIGAFPLSEEIGSLSE